MRIPGGQHRCPRCGQLSQSVAEVSEFKVRDLPLMVQILSGLITYLLLAIYCHNEHQEKVSIKRVRELRIKIQNEYRKCMGDLASSYDFYNQMLFWALAKT